MTSPTVAHTFSRLDSLFLTAATGEPRFASARDSAERLLRADPAATLEWLVNDASRPGRSLTPRQNHYVERLFTVIADSGRNTLPRLVLARAVAAAATDTAQARWLYIGSRIGDTAFRATARTYLRDTSHMVRRMAVRALGAYPHPAHPALLWHALEQTRGLERHMRLWALAQQPMFTSSSASRPRRAATLKRLAPLLADEELYNRRNVRDMMLKLSDSTWALLKPHKPHAPAARVRREWWLLAADAKGGAEFLKTERAKMSREDLLYFLGEASR